MDIKNTLILKSISLLKCPSVLFIGASVHELTNKRCVVKIPFGYRNRNPYGSMFLGALTSGADIAGSLAAYAATRETNIKSSVLFKDMHAEFNKKVVSSAYFVCQDVSKVRGLIEKGALEKGIPQSCQVSVKCVSNVDSEEVLAEFKMTLSVKVK